MSDSIISKDHFVACINVLKEGDEMARRINAIAREYGRDDFVDGYAFSNNETEIKLVETLELALNDIHHWISWFCFETSYGKDARWWDEEGHQHYFQTPEELYDFLIENKEQFLTPALIL